MQKINNDTGKAKALIASMGDRIEVVRKSAIAVVEIAEQIGADKLTKAMEVIKDNHIRTVEDMEQLGIDTTLEVQRIDKINEMVGNA